MASIHDLSTPCLLVDAERLERNLAAMQQHARAQRVCLRPHVKTHKSTTIAQRQIAHGAVGLTVAKVSEAERFAAAGFLDLRIAYPVVGEEKLRRLLRLAEHAEISFCVESLAAARAASAQLAAARRRLAVLIEVDCGYGRTGVRWDRSEARELIAAVRDLPGLELRGLLTHAGNAYQGGEDPLATRQRIAGEERDRLLELADRCRDLLGSPCELSIGSTPTAGLFRNRSHEGLEITELRPGTYALGDRTQVMLGSATLEECALIAWMTIVSRRLEDDGSVHVVADGGRKTLASDGARGGEQSGFGLVLRDPLGRREQGGASVYSLSEEHAWLRYTEAKTAPEIGERIAIVPNHVCTAVATQDRLVLVAGERVLETVPVEARGAVT